MTQPAQQRWRRILSLAWPLIISNSFWNLQLFIDRAFLGQYSTEALGAAMAVMGVFWVPMALLQGTASYVTTFVAQYFGAEEYDHIGPTLRQSILVSIVGGLLFFGFIPLAEPFFRMIGHELGVLQLEIEYFNALTTSALPTAIVAAISGYFIGLGRTERVMILNGVGLLLNAVLDYLLIFGNGGFPEMGAAGAGLATGLAGFGSAIVGFFLLRYDRDSARYAVFGSWRPNFAVMKQFLRYGLPSGLQWALEGIAFTVFLIYMGRLPNGAASLAASSIAVTVMMLSVLPAMGIAQAVMTLVGQHIGEGNPDEAARDTWSGVRISLAYMACVALSFVVIPDVYLLAFQNDKDPLLWQSVQHLAPQLLACVAIFTLFDSVYLNVSFALKGAGDTVFVSAIAAILPWPIMVLPSTLVSGPDAVVDAWKWIIPYSATICVILIYRFRQGAWRTMSVRS